MSRCKTPRHWRTPWRRPPGLQPAAISQKYRNSLKPESEDDPGDESSSATGAASAASSAIVPTECEGAELHPSIGSKSLCGFDRPGRREAAGQEPFDHRRWTGRRSGGLNGEHPLRGVDEISLRRLVTKPTDAGQHVVQGLAPMYCMA